MYLLNRIKGYDYICDRCQDCENPKQIISFFEYLRNKKNGFHYCDECWSYMNLRKVKCKCGNIMTNRTRYGKLPITCSCGESIWSK